jgi:sigma-B regulation protein RsbU (phosphoserine phosphatase)
VDAPRADVDALVAAVRHDLLRASSVPEAIERTLSHVRAAVGAATVIPHERARGADSRAAAASVPGAAQEPTAAEPVALGDARGAARDWMAAAGVDRAWALALRTPGGEPFGRLLVAPAEDRAPIDALLRPILEDLGHAVARLRAIDELRGELETHQKLVKKAGEALARDASEVVRALSELETRDAATKAELQQALRFQRATLPPVPRSDAFRCETLYLPADIISGDFYDVTSVGPERVRIFLADATGHGVAAGLATMFLKSEYEAQKRAVRGPSEVLASMNDLLVASYGNLELRFTALCADVDAATGAVRYAAAAHPPPLVARAERVEALPSGGSFVGIVAGVEYPAFEASLEPGDVLFCYTDGLVDAAAADGTLFGEARVTKVLAEARRARASPASKLVRALAHFVGRGRRLADDVAAVAFTRTE